MPQNWSPDEMIKWLVEEAGLSPDQRPAALDVTFEQIGLDSLAYLQLQAVVHDRFGVELPADGPADYTLDLILGAVNSAPPGLRDHAGNGLSRETPPAVAAHTDSSVWIDAEIGFVWAMTNDVASWPSLFTEYAAAEILERHGDTTKFRLTMHPDPTGKVWSWVSERTLDTRSYRVTARRVEPGPFEFMNIEWIYSPEGRGTRMRWVQDFHMRPDAPVDDEGMVARIKANTGVQLEVIRTKVEKAAADDLAGQAPS